MRATSAPKYEKFKMAMKGASRDEALNSLCFSLKRDKPLKYSAIEELEGSLSPTETARSADILAMLKKNSLLAEGKIYQAAQEIKSALERDPKNVFLQLELSGALHSCHNYLQELLIENSMDPGIESIYQFLKSESYLGIDTVVLYVKYLTACARTREAFECVRPLVVLFPGQRGLRPIVETLAQQIPHPLLMNYLNASLAEPEAEYLVVQRSASETLNLTRKFKEAQHALDPDGNFSVAEKIVRKIIGDWPKTPRMDPGLKDFYFMKARLEGSQGRFLDAVHCLQLITKMDPANIYARNYLDRCVQDAFAMVFDYVNKGEFLDSLCEFYESYSRYGLMPYQLIAEVAKQYARTGQAETAQELMNNLLATNSVDSDYLIVALDVALCANLPGWTDSLLNKMQIVYQARPWDLKLGAFLEDRAPLVIPVIPVVPVVPVALSVVSVTEQVSASATAQEPVSVQNPNPVLDLELTPAPNPEPAPEPLPTPTTNKTIGDGKKSQK